MEKNKKKPLKIYKAGLISLSLWQNKTEEGVMYTYTFQRSYKKDSEDEWRQTQNFGLNDIPRLKLLLEEAYKEQLLKKINNC